MAEDADSAIGVTLRPGAYILGRFQLERLLGRGGMAVVWLAQDSILEEPVALKFLPEVVVRDAHALALLSGEVKQARRLSHPNILRVHDLVMEEGIAAISMKWVDGPTLSEMRASRENGILETGDLEPWVSQMASALDYAHREAKLVHRDLKPSNFMVDSAGRIYITDFAIARSLADTTTRLSNQEQSGTLVYMSPQQLMGRNDPTNDIYSLGATFFDLLTGMPPFWTGNVTEQILKVEPPSVAERRKEFGLSGKPVSPAWERAIAACLAKEPENRPQTGAELVCILKGGPSPQRKTTPPVAPAPASTPEVSLSAAASSKRPDGQARPGSEDIDGSGVGRKAVAGRGPRRPAPRPVPVPPPPVEASASLPVSVKQRKDRKPAGFPWLHVAAAASLTVILLGAGWYSIRSSRPPAAPPVVDPHPAAEETELPDEVLPVAPQPELTDETERLREPLAVPFAVGREMTLNWIGPGAFERRDLSLAAPGPPMVVSLTRGFWMARHEVTQAQYEEIMQQDPSHFQGLGPDAPVERVDWFAAVEFCGRLTERERDAGRLPEGYFFTLPTEAQWEYACRAGTQTAFAFGDQLGARAANFNGNFPYGRAPRGEFRQQPLPVGSFAPNAFGLFDMHGNVREWCLDWYGRYPEENLEDPRGPLTGDRRVVRGGSWFDSARFCRSGHRLHQEPYFRSDTLGFRVVLVREEAGECRN